MVILQHCNCIIVEFIEYAMNIHTYISLWDINYLLTRTLIGRPSILHLPYKPTRGKGGPKDSNLSSSKPQREHLASNSTPNNMHIALAKIYLSQSQPSYSPCHHYVLPLVSHVYMNMYIPNFFGVGIIVFSLNHISLSCVYVIMRP